MRIINDKNENLPVPIKDFLITGEYDQDDQALIAYDDLIDFLDTCQVPYKRRFNKEYN